MKLQNYFQDPSSLHIGTEPLRAYYVPCREEAEANGADMLKASRAIILNGDDWKCIESIYGHLELAWENAPGDEVQLELIRAVEAYQERRGLLKDQFKWEEKGI